MTAALKRFPEVLGIIPKPNNGGQRSQLRCYAPLQMASHADEATAWLSDKARAMAEAIASLVEINSYTENPEGGRQVGALLRALFAKGGIEALLRPSERFADHLVFRSRPDLPNRGAVALLGHLDTVFPPGTFEGFRSDDTSAHGPGVLDMKGGLVVIAYALRALAATGGLDAVVPVRVVVVADEEVGSPEGQGVIAAAISGSSVCLVFEAGRAADAIITRRRGTGGMTAIAHGRASHAGNAHEEGANAIWAAARFVDAVQRLTDYDRGVTVNVGRIAGGHSKNTVPDRVETQLDLRFRTRVDGEQLVVSIQRAAEEAAAGVPGTRIELHGGISRTPLERTEESSRLCAEYAACARAHGLGSEEAPLIGGGSDASTAAALGIPAIDGLGPRGAGFHTKEERIELSSLVPKAQALARFLAQRTNG
jgi:glutamate carboxypeptidase